MPLEHNLEHRYALKTALEQLLGRTAWYELKETTSLVSWRKHTLKAIKAIRIGVQENVKIRDEAWACEVETNLARGESAISESKDIDDLLASFTATLLRQVFLQLGACPDRRVLDRVALTKENWRLNGHRSVQYVQSREQLESVFWSKQQEEIGFEAQMKLHNEHRWSKSHLSYSEWCRQRDA
ncbi:MAG: hypothetical protein KF892_24230 [Rhizobacter sp.]|nr:hypothetical protein [Rhizobacter sp.]